MPSTPQAARLVLACVAIGLATSMASTTLDAAIDAAELAASTLAKAVRDQYLSNGNIDCSRCKALDSCAATFPGADSKCILGYGNQAGSCNCEGRSLGLSASVVRQNDQASDQSVTNFVCSLQGIDATFLENQANDERVKWQYFGNVDGNFVIYPAQEWGNDAAGKCSTYDPRLRPWYVAAASGPKNLVVMLDTSGSMGQASRLSIAKQAATAVVNALSFVDYFAIVEFSSTASPYEEYLVGATAESKEKGAEFIDDLSSGGGTNFVAGFDYAFEILKRGRGSNCENVILFLTDGAAPDPSDTIAEHQKDFSTPVSIFSYTLGSGASTAVPKKVACANSGMYQHVPDGSSAALDRAMGSYYEYFAQGLVEAGVRWSEPYIDVAGLGPITTAAQAVYDDASSPPRFLGVVGVDVAVCELYEQWGGDATTAALRSRSTKCPGFSATRCQLEALRARHGGSGSVCDPTFYSTCPTEVIEGYDCAAATWAIDPTRSPDRSTTHETCPAQCDSGAAGLAPAAVMVVVLQLVMAVLLQLRI